MGVVAMVAVVIHWGTKAIDIHWGTKAKEVPVDFYAGAVAAFVIIVFAKFSTHIHRPKHTYEGRLKWAVGSPGHVLCICSAWAGLILALMMLGRVWLRGEVVFRGLVGLLAVFAGGILALDTGLERNGQEQEGVNDSRPAEANDPEAAETTDSHGRGLQEERPA
jgi:hypothetical protein